MCPPDRGLRVGVAELSYSHAILHHLFGSALAPFFHVSSSSHSYGADISSSNAVKTTQFNHL